jgi:hypothetical protein
MFYIGSSSYSDIEGLARVTEHTAAPQPQDSTHWWLQRVDCEMRNTRQWGVGDIAAIGEKNGSEIGAHFTARYSTCGTPFEHASRAWNEPYSMHYGAIATSPNHLKPRVYFQSPLFPVLSYETYPLVVARCYAFPIRIFLSSILRGFEFGLDCLAHPIGRNVFIKYLLCTG